LDAAGDLTALEVHRVGCASELEALRNGSEYDVDEYGRLTEQYETAKRGFQLVKQADKGNFDDIRQYLASEVEEEI